MKLLVTDLDGTLLGASKVYTEDIRRAAEKWQQAGHKLVIATGRLYSSGIYYADELGVGDYFIGCSGATIFKGDELIHGETIKPELVHRLWDYMNAHGGYCQIYSGKKVVANKMDHLVKNYARFKTIYGNRYEVPYEIRPHYDYLEPIHKLSFVFEDVGAAAQVLEMLGDLNGYNVFRSLPFLYDIISPRADKGVAGRWLQKHLGAETLYGIGDNENDTALLRDADFSGVIETAPDHVRREADMVVKKPEEGGFVDFVDHLLAMEE